LILFSKCIGFLIFHVRDISHTYIVSLGRALFVLLEIIEIASDKSIQGSSIFNPLAIFVYTSYASSLIGVYFHKTATIRSSLELFIHLELLFGYPNFV
jgi:hypothetical protein